MDGLVNGRMVHYVDYTGSHEAAVIIQVADKEEGIVTLFVFIFRPNNNIIYDVQYSAEKELQTWHWIEKEE